MAPIAARLTSPSGTATRRNRRWLLLQSPQCGIASSTKCEAMPAANAGTGRRVRAPISAPDKTWFVSSTCPYPSLATRMHLPYAEAGADCAGRAAGCCW